MTKREMQQKYCPGCRDDFYNNKNNLGVKECWGLESAKVIFAKLVHIDQRPPWTQKAKRMLNCYRPERYIQVGKDVVR